MATTVFRFPIGDLLVEIPEIDAIHQRLTALEATGGNSPALVARVAALEAKLAETQNELKLAAAQLAAAGT